MAEVVHDRSCNPVGRWYSAVAPKPAPEATPDEHRERLRFLAQSLERKLPFVAPELMREKIESYLWVAYEAGKAAPSSGVTHGGAPRGDKT